MKRFIKTRAGKAALEALAKNAGLEEEQGGLARMNARARAFRELTAMRNELERRYPAKPKIRKQPKRRTLQDRIRRLEARGFVRIQCVWDLFGRGLQEHAIRCAAAGVRLVQIKFKTKQVGVVSYKKPVTVLEFWLPSWAAAAADVSTLKLARRSKTRQEALRGLYAVAVAAKGGK